MKQQIFSAHDLTCIRGDELIFSSLDFSISSGDALVLSGPNGSGKSSFIRVLSGLIEAAMGEIFWEGVPISEDREGYRSLVHYVGHADPIKPVLTVKEHMHFWMMMARSKQPQQDGVIEAALNAFELTPLADSPGRILSSGQRRRLNLARILLDDRPLWLLDEPTVGLDKRACARLEHVIADHRASGGMVVLSTHTGIALDAVKTLDMAQFSNRLIEGDAS